MEFTDATTISMVKNLNVILSNVGDDSVLPYITNHAFPRVKFRLLTATDTLGRNVFYGKITDLSNPGVQRAAEILLEQVLSVDVVTTGIRQIVAKLACAMMTSQLAAQIDAQRDYAKLLEKQALDDLENFIRSPVLGGVVSAIQATVIDSHLDDKTLAMALDIDLNKVDPVKSTAETVTGATQAGNLFVYIDGEKLNIPVSIGDSPSTIMRKLSLLTVQSYGSRVAWISPSDQSANDSNRTRSATEVITIDKLKPAQSLSKSIVHNSKDITVNFTASVVESEFQPRNSSSRPVSFIGASLVHLDGTTLKPGVAGLLFGYGPNYLDLSSDANPTIFANIKNCSFNLPITTNGCHMSTDLLAFKLASGRASLSNKKDGSSVVNSNVLKYKIYLGSASKGEFTVVVQEGWTALNLVENVAKNIGEVTRRSPLNNVLASVIPTLKVFVGPEKTEVYTPALDFVGYTSDAETEVTFLFEITEMPDGLESAVVQKDLRLTQAFANFNTSKDSVLISGIALERLETVHLESSTLGGASAVQGNPSTQMKDGLNKIKRMLDTGM
jgi:hypothetical protein